jgi:hypothetical protein
VLPTVGTALPEFSLAPAHVCQYNISTQWLITCLIWNSFIRWQISGLLSLI